MTQSLRSANPSIRVANSIYDVDDADRAGGEDEEQASAVAPSDLEFDFDDEVVSGRAYRRALAQARAFTRNSRLSNAEEAVRVFPQPVASGLIQAQNPEDLSDNLTIVEATTKSLPQEPVPTRRENPNETGFMELHNTTRSPTLETSQVSAETTDATALEAKPANLLSVQNRAVSVIIETSFLASLFRLDVQRCQRCKKRLNGTVLKLDDGKHFHEPCFQCWVVRSSPASLRVPTVPDLPA